MSHAIRCSFCQPLPTVSHCKRGSRARCPLCKGELFLDGRSAITYRIITAEEKAGEGSLAPRVRKYSRLLAVVAAAMVLVAVGIWLRSVLTSESSSTADGNPERVQSGNQLIVHAAPRQKRQEAPTESIRPGYHKETPPAAVAIKVRGSWSVEAGTVKASTAMAIAKPIPFNVRSADNTPVATAKAPPARPAASVFRLPSPTESELLYLLRQAPEVELGTDPHTVGYESSREKATIAAQARAIQDVNKKEPDAFIRQLISKREDLAGLPFRLGKDCQLDKGAAQVLAAYSTAIRGRLDESTGLARSARSTAANSHIQPNANLFWSHFNSHNGSVRTGPSKAGNPQEAFSLARALNQMLSPQAVSFRWSLAQFLRAHTDKEATAILARLAVFDPDEHVRQEAIAVLKDRPARDYWPVLLEGMRYPWLPVVQNAARAVVVLRPTGAPAKLAGLLQDTDPCEPFEKEHAGKRTAVVREVVRINHHKNCLLCHAPADSADRKALATMVVGPVPAPEDPLPPSFSRVYYEERNAAALVRADITYLRQDFSVILSVKDHGKWPEQQRFDFFVRERPLTDAEVAQQAQRPRGEPGPSPYRQVLLFVLRELTGKDYTSVSYDGPRRGDLPVSSRPEPTAAGRTWRSACLR